MNTDEEKARDLATKAYSEQAMSETFIFAHGKNGCSEEKSEGYCYGFLNGFEAGYLYTKPVPDSDSEEAMSLEECKEEIATRLSEGKRTWREIMTQDFEYGVGLSKLYSVEQIFDMVAVLYAANKIADIELSRYKSALKNITEAKYQWQSHEIAKQALQPTDNDKTE